MEGMRGSVGEPTAFALGQDLLAVEIDLSIYSLGSALRACYKFTSQFFLFISRAEEAGWLSVSFLAKGREPLGAPLIGEFYNELLDQQIRESLNAEMGSLREIIVAQAFAEGNLLDRMRDEGNYEEDPLGIGRR